MTWRHTEVILRVANEYGDLAVDETKTVVAQAMPDIINRIEPETISAAVR